MALPEDAENLLLNEGFFLAEDSALGDDISEMERRRFPYYSEYGLEFCSQHVLNQRICPIITTFFEGKACILAHWLRYKAYPGHILCFRSGGPKAGRRRLVIQLLAKGSKVAYWSHAHDHELPIKRGDRLLHEFSGPALLAVGCKRTEKEFKNGGIAVFDGRIGFELNEGYAITFEFATVDVVERWTKMTLPNTPGLAEKVTAMQSPNIRINFAFEESPQNAEP